MSTEVIELGDLNTNNGETISLNTAPLPNSNTPTRSANFGMGAELLMNEKKKDGANTPTSDMQSTIHKGTNVISQRQWIKLFLKINRF